MGLQSDREIACRTRNTIWEERRCVGVDTTALVGGSPGRLLSRTRSTMREEFLCYEVYDCAEGEDCGESGDDLFALVLEPDQSGVV